MCYSMYGKRSDAAKHGIDTKATQDDMADKSAVTTPEAATARNRSEEKAFSSFRSRLQGWIGKGDKKREESVS